MRSRVKNILTALLLLALAACLILWKMEIIVFPFSLAGVSTWGLIVAAIMVVIIFHSIWDFFYPGIFFPLAVLCIIFDDVLGITAITPWIVLIVALLLTIAFEKLFPSHWIKKHFKKNVNKHINSGDNGNNTTFNFNYDSDTKNKEASYDDSEYVFHSLKMGSASKYISSPNLKKADLSSEFGELSVYFDKAQVPCGEVDIQARVAFGEMNIYIPRSWNVINKVSVSMGDCDDKASSTPGDENGPKCIINGSVSFGDMNIIKV
ncbi:MAG: cell wall-active antibiotics response protein [Lachnospiraceae bacterium]|nr:cell wall-active antibiotics response protein [Lachnospiraceae bacterium]